MESTLSRVDLQLQLFPEEALYVNSEKSNHNEVMTVLLFYIKQHMQEIQCRQAKHYLRLACETWSIVRVLL